MDSSSRKQPLCESGEGGREEMEGGDEIIWQNLRAGKRGGQSTPAASFLHDDSRRNLLQGPSFGMISSRKLAAALWELHHYKLPLDNVRRRHHGDRRTDKDVGPPPPTSFHLPESSRNLRRHVVESPMQHHRSIKRTTDATQTVSPSSYNSSIEIASCDPATPFSSIELKGRNGELTYSLRTSTELLKVMNRVWSLEEQHVSNTSLIEALKKELDRARSHAKELAREQQCGRHELMKHITGGKLLTKKEEQDRTKAIVQSIRDEFENERKLRKHSESLQRELAQELYEVKISLATVFKELENERTSRGLVEDLCDELAWGLRDCEKELHDQRQKSDQDLGERDDRDQWILRISQAWLDERMQVKQQSWGNEGELSSQIGGSLQNETIGEAKINGSQMQGNPMFRRSSLESIPLNLGASARREEDDDEKEDGSSGSKSNFLEVEKTSESTLKPQRQKKIQETHYEEMLKQKEWKEKLEPSEWTKAPSPSRLQAKFEEHMMQAMAYGISGNLVEGVEKKAKAEIVEAAKDNISEDKQESEGNSETDAIKNIIKNYYLFPESRMEFSKDHVMASSLGRSFQSPVHEWSEKLPAQDRETSQPPQDLLPELKESTLREKLVEARTRGQKSRSRQKALIYPSGE